MTDITATLLRDSGLGSRDWVITKAPPSDNDDLFRDCFNKWGNLQLDVMIEEMAELTKALIKYKRQRLTVDNYESLARPIIEELADVSLMLDQMVWAFGDYSEIKKDKIARLKIRLHGETTT